MDFKKATELFADPDFDGEPVQIYNPGPDDPINPPEDEESTGGDGDDGFDIGEGNDGDGTGGDTGPSGRIKYLIGDVPVYLVAERVQYYGPDGKLITESLKDYCRRTIEKTYASLDAFLDSWTHAGKKKLVIEELEQQGVLWDALAEEVGKDLDPFDLICHVVFGQPPLTRKERASKVRKRDYFTKYGGQARLVLNALLDKYADEGIENLEDKAVLKVPPFDELGTPVEIVRLFGGKKGFEEAVQGLAMQLYTQ